MPQQPTTALTAAQVRELSFQLTEALGLAGVVVDLAAVQAEMPSLLRKVGAPLVGHTCTSTGKPLPYGKLAPEGECERCDERRAEKAAGIPARPAPAWTANARRRADNDRMASEALTDHFRPGGPHARGECGPVCTFGDW